MRIKTLLYTLFILLPGFGSATGMKSIREFGVLPSNSAEQNKINLQKAIDWATASGSALFVEPSEHPYPVNGGLTLKKNVSLIGVHGPTPRGTVHKDKHPVGSVFAITDREKAFITVETGTQIKGIQFWYPEQTTSDPEAIIPYPPTIRVSQTDFVQGVYLSCLTFYGEYLAFDFYANPKYPCELMTFEHCYGYPLSGEFIRIDYCYDIPRVLHCHVNPAAQRFIRGQIHSSVVDSVIARKTFAYSIHHTDNAQLIDLFTFGTYGGIHLGPATYGQLTNFNLDCVGVGIYKEGDNKRNRNWMIAQGSIIANVGDSIRAVHPIVFDGMGHMSITNVEAFSGDNQALTTLKGSWDFLTIKGDQKCTVSLTGCRMRNYAAGHPLTILNSKATLQVTSCFNNMDEPVSLENIMNPVDERP